jgi:DNA-binding GntR family transcriptional regulator
MTQKFSLTQDAYERLRADLLSCRLKPGERLRINDLCKHLSVSLGAVREALSRLTSEGLVSAEPQLGFSVAPISAVDLKDLTMVRTEIEGLCLRHAVAVGDLAWESRIVAAFHRLSRTPHNAPDDPQRLNDSFASAHAAFHQELVSACTSPWLHRMRETLFAQSARYIALSVPLARQDRDRNQEHRELMDAVISRDADRAAELMTAHLNLTTQILIDALAAPANSDALYASGMNTAESERTDGLITPSSRRVLRPPAV